MGFSHVDCLNISHNYDYSNTNVRFKSGIAKHFIEVRFGLVLWFISSNLRTTSGPWKNRSSPQSQSLNDRWNNATMSALGRIESDFESGPWQDLFL